MQLFFERWIQYQQLCVAKPAQHLLLVLRSERDSIQEYTGRAELGDIILERTKYEVMQHNNTPACQSVMCGEA